MIRSDSPKRKKNIFLRLSLLALTAYVVVMLIQLTSEISAKQAEADSKQAIINAKTWQNEEMQNKVNHPGEYMEQEARARGYGFPGEDVWKESP